MTFAENLNRICREKETTPTTILREMGVATNKVTLWNNGALPKQEMLVRLARHLGCSVMDFFVDESTPKAIGVPSVGYPQVEFALDEDERDIIRLFRTLSRQQKHEFMAQAYSYEKEHLKEE
jgi:hypothetical protein